MVALGRERARDWELAAERPMFTRKSTAIFCRFGIDLTRIWCTFNGFQTTYGPKQASEGAKFFLVIYFPRSNG
jgi:hypothetical protein